MQVQRKAVRVDYGIFCFPFGYFYLDIYTVQREGIWRSSGVITVREGRVVYMYNANISFEEKL
jgi:hypothetical protein